MKTGQIEHKTTSDKSKNASMDCLTAWQNAAPSLMFEIRGTRGEVILSPQNETQLPKNPQFISGTLNDKLFWLLIDPDFFNALFLNIGFELEVNSMAQTDVPLVLEHLFTEYFQSLEAVLDCQLAFKDFTSHHDVSNLKQFDFTIHSMESVFEGKLFTDAPNILNKLTTALFPYQVSGEKNCTIVSDVAIGPIVLSKSDVSSLSIGDLVSIGKGADQNLDGFIRRANGSTWKALLGGASALIKSSKQPFEELFKSTEDEVLLGLKIGTTNISANKLLQIKLDDELVIDRLPENAVHLILDGQTLASGTLQTSGGHLCIAIDQLEVPHAND